MRHRLGIKTALLLILMLGDASEALAQKGRRGSPEGPSANSELPLSEEEGGLSPEALAAFAPQRSTLEAMEARGFITTGLIAQPPLGVTCPAVTSAFGVITRGDGSQRSLQFFHGRHGGLDIPVPEGAPVLAMAAGSLVAKGAGVAIGGISLVLRHAPEDTGLPFWSFTEYKHLREEPALELGQRVAVGEVIAFSGKSGTQGRHYGSEGHAHLHVSAFWNSTGEYHSRRIFAPVDGYWLDPLAMFRGQPHQSAQLAALPDKAKLTPIAVQTITGRRLPQTAKIIWPLNCVD